MATKLTKHQQTIISRHFFETDYFQFEKKNESRTVGVPGVFVTSRLSVKETLRKLNSLRTKTPNDSSDSVKLIVNPKKVYIPV